MSGYCCDTSIERIGVALHVDTRVSCLIGNALLCHVRVPCHLWISGVSSCQRPQTLLPMVRQFHRGSSSVMRVGVFVVCTVAIGAGVKITSSLGYCRAICSHWAGTVQWCSTTAALCWHAVSVSVSELVSYPAERDGVIHRFTGPEVQT